MFSKVTATLYLHLAPKFVNDPMKGVEDHLNRMLLKFNKDIGGVIMSYTNVQLLTDRATILFDSPFMHFHIACDLVVFAPAVASRIRGVINKQSQTHIGLLVFNLFNVSIGNADIPSDQFVFQADAGAGDNDQEQDGAAQGHHDNRFRKARHTNALTGNWVHAPTQTTLSVGTDLEFVVTEVVRSHNFINIKGSLSGIEFSAQTPAPSAASFSTGNTQKNPKLVVFGDDDDDSVSALVPPPAAAAAPATSARSEKRKRKRDSEPAGSESAESAPADAAAAEVKEDADEAEGKRASKKSGKRASKKSSEATAVDGEKATKKRKKGGD